MEKQTTAHTRIIEQYFETTSSSHTNLNIGMIKSTIGIKRGFSKWLESVKGKRVLELGSGTGEFCWLMKQMGASRVVGVNLSSEEINISRSQVDTEFVLDDISNYLKNCPNDSFDFIVGLNILEHLEKDTLVEVLENSRRCLVDGGTLLAMVPNATSPFGSMTRYWDFTHHLSFTPSSTHQLMKLTGFKDVEFREWGPRIHGIKSFVRFYLWKVIRNFIKFWLIVETGSDKGNIYTADMIFKLTK